MLILPGNHDVIVDRAGPARPSQSLRKRALSGIAAVGGDRGRLMGVGGEEPGPTFRRLSCIER
jgi:hypothetical protein